MKKMLSVGLLFLSLTTAIRPQQANAAVILGAGAVGGAIYAVKESEGVAPVIIVMSLVGAGGLVFAQGFFRLGLKLVNYNASAIGVGLGVLMMVFDENLMPEDQIPGQLAKIFPEINDQSLINDISDSMISQYKEKTETSDTKVAEIKLDASEIQAILERSDLSNAQIKKIVNTLN